jgi:hypothetical protein
MAPRYKVILTKEERKDLEAISTKGKRAARTVYMAQPYSCLMKGNMVRNGKSPRLLKLSGLQLAALSI